jgi:hypothetical protein
MWWPDGWGTTMRLLGRCRDLLTAADGSAVELADDLVRASVDALRRIEDISSEPGGRGVEALVGASGGGRLRSRLAEVLPAELAGVTPLYLLLDDLSGATLISGFAYSQWPEHWPAEWRQSRARVLSGRTMTGVCAGFRPGSSALNPDGTPRFIHDVRAVAPLPDPNDPAGWHPLPTINTVAMRRARRIDVHRADGQLRIDAMFQDSATVPAGGRVAVHEYHLTATGDEATGLLTSVAADPRVLPYRECPLAAANVDRLVGVPLRDLRQVVLDRLHGTIGCTHLNDALRALAEVPALAAAGQKGATAP